MMKYRATRNPYQRVQALLLCVGALLAIGAFANSTMAFGKPQHKVVIQVSTGDEQVQRIALNNAMNLRKAFGMDAVKVVIVAYGPGLSLLTAKSAYPDRITSMAMQGISFRACHNTMEGIKRHTGHMPELQDGVEVVPSGVTRIVKLQEKGYAYVRP